MNVNEYGSVSTEEIESVLRNHDAIAEVAVTLDNGKYAERLVAWIVCKHEMEVDIPAIRQHIKKLLPSHTIPLYFIFTKQLPLDTNGEVDRAALSFDAVERNSSGDNEGPRNLLESIITDIWKTIIGQERMGIHDEFLDLGGDSIQAGLISLKIRECFNVEIPLVMFFEDMTVAKLAEEVYRCQENDVVVPLDRILPIDRNGNIPLSLSQEERLSYEFGLDVNNIQHTNPSVWFSIKLSGDLDKDALETAFNYVINRHEVFRTAIWPEIKYIAPMTNKWDMVRQLCSINPKLVLPKVIFKQSIQSSVTMDITYHDISKFSDEERDIEFNAISSEFIQKRYMYESPPLTRAALIRIAAKEHILIVAASHLITDAVSMQIYEKELAQAYNALVNKEQIILTDNEIQYIDYVAWYRHQLETGVFESIRSYWKQQFQGYIPTDVTILPFADTEVSENDEDFGIETKYYFHPISNELEKALRKYAGSANLTVFSIVMTGFILYLYGESGKDDIGVFTFFSNRTRPEIGNTIGMIATGNIVRVKIKTNDSLYKCAVTVFESLNGALKNQEFMIPPFDSRFNRSLYDLVVHRSITCELLVYTKCALFSRLDVEKVFVGQSKSEHALKSMVVDSGSNLFLMFQYNLDLFDRADIQRMAERTENIIKNIIINPSSVVSSIVLC